jgi:flagella basal body P-ring formation protein FlgA
LGVNRKDYVLALRDADFAFENNYPIEMQHKLHERIGRCHLALGSPEKAKESLEKSVENLEKFAPKGERKKSKLKVLQTLIKECEENKDFRDPNVPTSSEKYLENLVPKLPNPHSKFPAFSDAVEVRYGGPAVGRFCVAKRPIEPGELLAVETPYVWLLDKVT